MFFAVAVDVDDIVPFVVVLPSIREHLMDLSLQVYNAVLVWPDDLQQRGVEEGREEPRVHSNDQNKGADLDVGQDS